MVRSVGAVGTFVLGLHKKREKVPHPGLQHVYGTPCNGKAVQLYRLQSRTRYRAQCGNQPHVLQPAKKLNNSAVSKPRAEGERRKILDLFFDAKTIQNPSERSERRKISSQKIWRAQRAGKKFKHAPFKSSKQQTCKNFSKP